jgi:hypothetical protein
MLDGPAGFIYPVASFRSVSNPLFNQGSVLRRGSRYMHSVIILFSLPLIIDIPKTGFIHELLLILPNDIHLK